MHSAHALSAAAPAERAAAGAPDALTWILRLEGLALLVAATLMYRQSGFGWGTFATFFLAPDLALLAYFAGPRAGAIAYNATHSTIGALACFSAGLALASPALEMAGLVWCAHIGFDRALGYGLKRGRGFEYTHLGRIGRRARAAGTVTEHVA
jgi:hypothetical protein